MAIDAKDLGFWRWATTDPDRIALIGSRQRLGAVDGCRPLELRVIMGRPSTTGNET